jgi:hypothetical protein
MLGRNLALGVIALFCSMQASIASAIMVQVLPDRTMMNVNETLSVDVSISGLGDRFPPSVGLFDIDLGFDPLLFTLGTVTFGDQLDFSPPGSVQDSRPGSGRVNVFEDSFIDPHELDIIQRPSFLLFNVEFTAKSAGVGFFPLDFLVVLDARKAPLFIDPFYIIPSVAVKNPPAVPVPAAVWLFGTALIGLVGFSKRKSKVAA